MKAIKFDLPADMRLVEIIPLADAHIGDKYADEQFFLEKIKYIAETPNTFCILNGDLLNNALTSSVSDSYSELLSPMEAMQRMVALLKPIKEKIICITIGNHERRTWKSCGLDIMRLIAVELGIEERYSEGSAVIFLRVGAYSGKHHHRKVAYSIFVNHGSGGGGRKEGGKINRLVEMAEIADCDIYICSHTHLPAILRNTFYRTEAATRTVTKVQRLFVNTSGMMDYGGYGEQMLFKPNSVLTPHIYLSGDAKEFYATL